MLRSDTLASSPLATVDRLAELLRWYAEMGVDAVMDEQAHDRFSEADVAPPAFYVAEPVALVPAPPEPLRLPARPAAQPPDQANQTAQALAAACDTLDALRAALDGFDGCTLKRSATQLVFEDGNRTARIMLVGEAPGAEEDRTGKPFTGRAGQLLDLMLAACGLDRTSVYIANIVPWRPPGNIAPTPVQTAACLPFVQRQIALARPDHLVCLGAASTAALLGLTDGIIRTRGRWFDYDCDGRIIPAMAMLHPEYLLKQPLQKRLAWRDWRAVMQAAGPQGVRG